MQVVRVVPYLLAALLVLLNTVAAEDLAASAQINYLISFHDHAEDKDISGVEEWLKAKKAEIVETVKESYVKFIVAKTDSTIMELLKEKDERKIEAIEEDDFSYDEL